MYYHVIILFRASFLAIALALLSAEQGLAQDKFALAPIAPGDSETTWIDIFSTATKIHIDLPTGMPVPPSLKTDSTKSLTFILIRKLKVLSKDGNDVQTLQVVYIKPSDLTGVPLPPTEDTPRDLSASLQQGKVYQVNCKNGTVTIDSTAAAVSDQEATLAKRECTNLQRTSLIGQTLGEMKIDDSKSVSSSPSLFSEDIEKLGINNWDITLRALRAQAPVQATFDITGKADTSTPTGQSFPEFKGKLLIDDKASVIDLTLQSSSVHVEPLPDGKSQISSKGDLTIKFRKQLLQ